MKFARWTMAVIAAISVFSLGYGAVRYAMNVLFPLVQHHYNITPIR
jgi:hypothetical protein